jgi:hypothetical protein
MSLLAPRLSIRRNPANYDIKWESMEYEDQLELTPIRGAYPDSWVMAGIERLGGGGAEGYVTVLTADHGFSAETQEMNRTLAQFDMHPDQSGMMRHYQELVMRLVGGGPPRIYYGQMAWKSVDEAKAFVDRVIAAVQKTAAISPYRAWPA